MFSIVFLKMCKDELDRTAKGKLFHKNAPEPEKARKQSGCISLLARIEGLDHGNEVKISD